MRELLGFAKTTFRAEGDDDFPPAAQPSPTSPKDSDSENPARAPAADKANAVVTRITSAAAQQEPRSSDAQPRPVTKTLPARCHSADSRLGPRLSGAIPRAAAWAEAPGLSGCQPPAGHTPCGPQRPASRASSVAPSNGWGHMPRFERVLVPRHSLLPGTEAPSPMVQLRWRAEPRVPSRTSSRLSGSSTMTRPSTGLTSCWQGQCQL
jgi:hypothetical protein